jgi:hypothetical protein
MMTKKMTIALLAVLLLGIAFGCRSKPEVKGIELEIIFPQEELSDYLITDMQYKWKTGDEFVKMDQDMNIFVRFWHRDNLLIEDDHVPDVPTSEWEPNKEYTYSRRILIPSFIDEFDPTFKGEETLRLSVGFFSPFDPSRESEREVFEEKLKVVPPPIDTPEVIYEEGWYDLEIDPEAFLKQWRWTAQKARCIIDNPNRDALLLIKGGVNLEAVDQQQVIFKINDLVLDDFYVEESYFEKSYSIKKEMLGEGDEFILTIETGKTFVPSEVLEGSTDQRELGIQISLIYFR